MKKQEYKLECIIKDYMIGNISLKSVFEFIKNNENLKCELKEMTSFLDNDSKINLRLYCALKKILEKPVCKCGKQLRFRNHTKGFFATCGSEECKIKALSENSIRSNKTKDWKSINEKIRKTNLERYGYEHNFSDKENREKIKQTMQKLYGVDHALQNKEFSEKQQKTLLDRFGTTNMLNIEKVKNKIIEKYGYLKPMQNKEIAINAGKKISNTKSGCINEKIKKMNLEIVNQKNSFLYDLKCLKCGDILYDVTRPYVNICYRNDEILCHNCNPNPHVRSKGELELFKELQSFYNDEIQLNRKYLGREMDVIIPEKKICIEYNGIYYHSDLFKDKHYHIDKKKFIEEKGYEVIYIWEDDWFDNVKKEIIISRLKNKLGYSEKIYARKCELKEVKDNELVKKFLNDNHLHGFVNSKIKIGLFYDKELISICTFGDSRHSIGGKNKNGMELLRNCTRKGYVVIGGFEKILKYFIKTYKTNLYSYADYDWVAFNNSSYEKIGFKKIGLTPPNYHWVVNGKRQNRINFQKHKLVKMGYDKNKTEDSIMREDLKAYRTYNCGNILFEYSID